MKNVIRNAFKEIHAEDSIKNDTMNYLREKTCHFGERKPFVKRYAVALASCMTLAFMLTGVFSVFSVSYSINVDVNPSIELGINRFDMVVSVVGVNDDGKTLADSLDMKFMNYADALEMMIDGDILSSYIENGDPISITVIGDTTDKNDEILKCINSRKALNCGSIHCYQGNREDVSAAYEAGLSLGKYRAFLELQALNPEIKAQDVQGLTMREIRDMINVASGKGYIERHNGNGKGYEYGHRGWRHGKQMKNN